MRGGQARRPLGGLGPWLAAVIALAALHASPCYGQVVLEGWDLVDNCQIFRLPLAEGSVSLDDIFPDGVATQCDGVDGPDACTFAFFTTEDGGVHLGRDLPAGAEHVWAWFLCSEPGGPTVLPGPTGISVYGIDLTGGVPLHEVQVIDQLATTPTDLGPVAANTCCGCWPTTPQGTVPCKVLTGPDPQDPDGPLAGLEDLTSITLAAKQSLGSLKFRNWIVPNAIGSVPSGEQAPGQVALPNSGSFDVLPGSRPHGTAVALYEGDACASLRGGILKGRCRVIPYDQRIVIEPDVHFTDWVCQKVRPAAAYGILDCPGCPPSYRCRYDLVIDEGWEYFHATVRDPTGKIVARETPAPGRGKTLSFGPMTADQARKLLLVLEPVANATQGVRVRIATHLTIQQVERVRQ
jgi:hypothetical protein